MKNAVLNSFIETKRLTLSNGKSVVLKVVQSNMSCPLTLVKDAPAVKYLGLGKDSQYCWNCVRNDQTSLNRGPPQAGGRQAV